ncbi:MAG: RHS repeat domain-containing protein, partial [Acidimicrobiales bacterium]
GVDSAWTFDDSGVAVSLAVAGHVVSFRYDPAGREIERTTDDGVALTQVFDAEHQLTGQTVTTPEHRVVQQRRYHYHPDGQLTAVEDAVSGPVQYRLDTAGRVTDVAAADGTEEYRYGPDGIVSEAHRPVSGVPVAGFRSRDAHRFSAPLGGVYAYDRQGRLVSRQEAGGAWAYSWDPLDRLTGVRTPDGTTWRYHYDPLGRRIAKQRLTAGPAGPVVAEEVTFVWSGQHLVEQIHRDGQGRLLVLTWDHHPGTTRPVTQTEHLGEGVRFFSFVTNPIGTPVDLVDSRGVLAWHGTTTLWGKAKPQRIAGTSTPLRFPGQYADDETGLHYNVFRYYDPATGRYLSQDPLGLAPAPDPVGYVPNPLLQADPLGLGCGGSKEVAGEGDGAARPHEPASDNAAKVQDTNPTGKLPDNVKKTGDDAPHDNGEGPSNKPGDEPGKGKEPETFDDKMKDYKDKLGVKSDPSVLRIPDDPKITMGTKVKDLPDDMKHNVNPEHEDKTLGEMMGIDPQ